MKTAIYFFHSVMHSCCMSFFSSFVGSVVLSLVSVFSRVRLSVFCLSCFCFFHFSQNCLSVSLSLSSFRSFVVAFFALDVFLSGFAASLVAISAFLSLLSALLPHPRLAPFQRGRVDKNWVPF